jgi:methylmalonyl-CoA mutase
MSDKKNLLEEFPPVTTENWEAKINTDLKGADYDKKLVWKTMEGFNVKPYYRNEHLEALDYLKQFPGEFPYLRGKKIDQNEWYIRQDIHVKDVTQANKIALEILQKGVTSLGFVISNKAGINATFLEKLLKDICLSAIEINFVCGIETIQLIPLFINYLKKQGYDQGSINGSFSFDPLGHLVSEGCICFNDKQKVLDAEKKSIGELKSYPNIRAITIHGSYFANAGGSIVQSLAFALAMGAEYLTQLTEAGLSASDIASKLKFNFAVSSNYFMEIAKFRAARLLWAKIVECYDMDCKEAMCIHAETAKWNMTVYDPYVNILRSTTEAMSAALGGVDSMTVNPFDITYEKPTDLSGRIARNAQIILQEESYFNKVVDPSAGSYYIENLTDSIVAEAWKLFLQVQDKGGFTNAFKEGFIQNQVNEVAKKRENGIATRREILLGTNQYPNFNELIQQEVCDLSYACCSKFTDGKCDEEDSNGNNDDKVAEPLHQFRGAQAFEELRQKTDKSEYRPKVFMLSVGNLAMRKARATFSFNFFACASFEGIDNNGFETIEEGAKAALDAKADIVVLCSSDDEYAVFAPEAFEKLKDKTIFVVAGDPACKADLEAKGIKNFISIKSNILETLKYYQKELKL